MAETLLVAFSRTIKARGGYYPSVLNLYLNKLNQFIQYEINHNLKTCMSPLIWAGNPVSHNIQLSKNQLRAFAAVYLV